MHLVRKVGGTSMSTMRCTLHVTVRLFRMGFQYMWQGGVEDGPETLPKSFTRLMTLMCEVTGDYLLKEYDKKLT